MGNMAEYYRDRDELDFTIDSGPVWITADKRHLPVKDMTTDHIKNVIRCLNGKGEMTIPRGYLGGKVKWIKIFRQELKSRKL
jgi:hypothetical protein